MGREAKAGCGATLPGFPGRPLHPLGRRCSAESPGAAESPWMHPDRPGAAGAERLGGRCGAAEAPLERPQGCAEPPAHPRWKPGLGVCRTPPCPAHRWLLLSPQGLKPSVCLAVEQRRPRDCDPSRHRTSKLRLVLLSLFSAV